MAVELRRLEDMVSDLATQHKKEISKNKKMDIGELEARKEVRACRARNYRA